MKTTYYVAIAGAISGNSHHVLINLINDKIDLMDTLKTTLADDFHSARFEFLKDQNNNTINQQPSFYMPGPMPGPMPGYGQNIPQPTFGRIIFVVFVKDEVLDACVQKLDKLSTTKTRLASASTVSTEVLLATAMRSTVIYGDITACNNERFMRIVTAPAVTDVKLSPNKHKLAILLKDNIRAELTKRYKVQGFVTAAMAGIEEGSVGGIVNDLLTEWIENDAIELRASIGAGIGGDPVKLSEI